MNKSPVALFALVLVAACPAFAGFDGLDHLHLSHVHRGGGARERPDNTLETFRWCWQNGSAVECDCRMTKDGVGIMLHDDNLRRTGRGISAELASRSVSKELTWDEIKNVDVGSYLDRKYAAERIPTIEATFAAMKENKTWACMVDDKGAGPRYIADKARAAGVLDQVYYTGASYSNAVEWTRQVPGGKTLLWIGTWPAPKPKRDRADLARFEAHYEKIMADVRAGGFKGLSLVSLHSYYNPNAYEKFVPSAKYLKGLVDEFHAHGIPVCSIPFEGGDKVDAYLELRDLGFDCFSTDHPSVTFGAIAHLKDFARPKLTTEFGEKVTVGNAWRDYPRPQMTRPDWTNLNGLWKWAVTKVTDTPGRPERWEGDILVPFALESKLSGVARPLKPNEFLWYTRKIDGDHGAGERVLLHFGGVDFRTMVFIGHEEVTDVPHEGGQNPFTLDITDYLKPGENDLTVCVWDPTEDFVNSRGKQSFFPIGCFYTRVSGIWQTVWMEKVPAVHVRDWRATTDIDRGEATLDFALAGAVEPGTMVTVTVAGVGECAAPVRGLNARVTVKMPAGFRLWSPASPHLYDFKARVGADEIGGYFGMRKFEKRKDAKGVLRFYLNNEPIFLLGTLDQGWWPDGLLTPPSEEAMAHDILTLKRCGYNMMRKHIKVEPLRYYHLCDKLGILVIQDLPSGSHSWADPMLAATVRRYWLERQEMKEMMDALYNSPAIVMWNPYNEGWTQPGEFLTHQMLDFTRRHDPTRLVNGPSGCWDWEGGELLCYGWEAPDKRPKTKHRPLGACEAADTVDYHIYRGPTMFPVNDRRVSFLGEFGGLGHPVAGHMWKESKGSWGYGGIKDTSTREGLEKVYLGLLEKVGDLAERGLGGAVYTQTTDVEIEINGLMTYDRKVLKYDPDVLAEVHRKVIERADRAAR